MPENFVTLSFFFLSTVHTPFFFPVLDISLCWIFPRLKTKSFSSKNFPTSAIKFFLVLFIHGPAMTDIPLDFIY